MIKLLKIISAIGLILTLVPSLFVFANYIDLPTHKNLMALGTALWFLSAPFWMNRRKEKAL